MLRISVYVFYLFKSWILLTNQSGLLMRVISTILWATLILNTVHDICPLPSNVDSSEYPLPVKLSVLFFILFPLHTS